jgi:hypothetical protein
MRFLGLVFFHKSTTNRSLMNVKKYFIIFSWIRGDICARSLTFRGFYRGKACLSGVLFSESQNFPRIIQRRGMPIRGIICGKARNRELFCVKEGFPMVKSAESFDFPWITLRKGMPFRRVIRGKSKLSADHTAERHAFPQGNPRKVKTSRELPCGKFQYTAESQNLTF